MKRYLLSLVLGPLLFALPAWGQMLDEEGLPGWERPIELRVVPGQKLDDHTVLVLNNGEALRGDLDNLIEGKLEFDSDKLGDLQIDLEDVRSIRSRQRFVIILDSVDDIRGTKLRGRIRLEGDLLTVYLSDGTNATAQRKDLLALLPIRGESEFDKWKIKISLQFSTSFGNTRNGSFLLNGFAKRRSGSWLWRVDGEASQSQADGDEFEKARQGRSQLDYDLSALVFLTPYFVDARYDKFQNIALRGRAGVGVGIRVFNEQNLHWTLEAAPAYNHNVARDAPAGENRTDNTAVFRVASRFEIELFDDDVSLYVLGETFIGVSDIKDTTHAVRATLSIELLEYWTVDLSVSYDRIENPQRNSDGELPQRDDVLIGLGFGFDY